MAISGGSRGSGDHTDPFADPLRAGRRTAERSTGAWAAAATVLAVGALIFAVSADRRANHLENRLVAVEQAARGNSTTSVGASSVSSTTVGSQRSSTTTGGGTGRSTTTVLSDPLTAGEQPADPAAAQLEIRTAVATLFSGDPEAGSAVVDDPTGVDTALVAFGERGPARPVFSQIRFQSSTDARVDFRLYDATGGVVEGQRVMAVDVGGSWRLDRASVCNVFSALSAPCAA